MEIYLDAIIALLSLLAAWVFACTLYRDYRNDAFRQEIFALRDELFDLARSGRVKFTDPAYMLLRSSLNGLLYVAEDISVVTTVMLMSSRAHDLDWREHDRKISDQWEAAISGLGRDEAGKLKELRARASNRVVEHLILTSPLFFVTVVPLLIVVVASLIVAMVGSAAKRPVTRLMQYLARVSGVDALTFVDDAQCSDGMHGQYVPVRVVRPRC